MKKNFFKKLAAGLALAMVVTSVAPAATASAATSQISGAPSTVYVTKAYKLKLGKNVKATWRSKDKSVATVGLTGGVLKPVAPGKVQITSKSKVTGKTYKKTFTVKQRATEVDLGDDLQLEVGDTATLEAKLTPETSTDVIRYHSDNQEVATVGMTGGKVTAKGVGEATITVYSKATTASSNKSAYTKTDEIKVEVGTFIDSAVQDTTTKLDVNFNTDMKGAKASDFSIVSDDTKRNFAIKEASVDGKKVTLETFADINDGKTYTVTYKDQSYKFVATDNKVASIAITPATVQAETKTEIKVLTKDANGVTLSENPYGNIKDSKVEFNIETTAGYTEGSELYLFKVGDTAKATAKYHTYDYVDGKEVGLLETELTITAVDKEANTIKDYKYTVGTKRPSNWDTATLNDKLAVEDGVKSLYVYLKDNKGEVTDGYSLSSSNDNVLLVNDKGGLKADLVAVTTGTAYVLVKDVETDKVVLSLSINIVAERKASSLSLDKNTVTLALASTGDSSIVKATVRDQYGDKIKVDNWNEALKAESANAPSISVAGEKVTVADSNFEEAGTYHYNVKYGNLVQPLTVIVKDQAPETNKSVTYAPVLSDDKIDVIINDDVTENKDITAKVKVLRGGVFAQYADIQAFEVKNVTTNKVVQSGSAVNADEALAHAITLGETAVKNMEPGSYTFKIEFAKYEWKDNALVEITDAKGALVTQTITRGFVVVDTQPKVEVKQVKDSADTIQEAFEFYYNGKKLDAPNMQVADETVNGKVHFIKKAKVDVVDGNTTVRITVEINKSVKLK